METRKSLILSAGVIAIVALLAATNALAQNYNTCASETTKHTAGNFIVNVAQTTLNGRRTYTYTMTSPTGKNTNKFFVYVRDGLEGNLESASCSGTTCSPGIYVDHNETTGGVPPAEVWMTNRHEDGVVITNVAIDKVITLKVSERFLPEESVTTILLGIGSTYEHCGPIFGPTNPEAPFFQGSPLVTTTSRQTFANGCAYFVTAGETDNIITAMTADPATPNATVFPFEQCVVFSNASCEGDLGLTFCPPAELGRPPLQSVPGGTCYYPKNLKFTC